MSPQPSLADHFLRSPITDALVVISALREQATRLGETDLAWRLAMLAVRIETDLLSRIPNIALEPVQSNPDHEARKRTAIAMLKDWCQRTETPWLPVRSTT